MMGAGMYAVLNCIATVPILHTIRVGGKQKGKLPSAALLLQLRRSPTPPGLQIPGAALGIRLGV